MRDVAKPNLVARVTAGLLAGLAWAVPSHATVQSATFTEASCSAGITCSNTVYLNSSIVGANTGFISGSIDGLNPATDSFTTAFTNWNNAHGDSWTLVNGGVLPLNLSVSINGGLGTNVGGLGDIIISIANYSPVGGEPSLDQLVWAQGLVANYTPALGLVASPQVSLDTYSFSSGSSGSNGAFTNACTALPGQSPGANNTTPSSFGPTTSSGAYCDPIYPFQYGTRLNGNVLDGISLSTDFFYDAPAGPWPDAAFRAIALLATVSFDTNAAGAVTSDVLTVYQGVSYGFSLSVAVPEPPALAVLATALVALCRLRRRGVPAG